MDVKLVKAGHCEMAMSNYLELILAWRNNPEVFKGFYIQKDFIDWQTHFNWWTKQKHRWTWMIEVIEDHVSRLVGYISVHETDTDSPEIDITIGEPKLWGQGIAKQAITQIIRKYRGLHYGSLCARIIDSNTRSQKLFEALGFEREAEIHPGQYTYLKEL